MSTPDPVEVAYDVLADAMTHAHQDDPAGQWLSDLPPDLLAQRIAAAYGLAGLLLPDGGETTQEWAVLSDSATTIEQAMNGEDHARQILARYYTGDPTAYVAHRTAHYGRWQPAPDPETTP
jgi:hypothetical protein